MGRWVNGKLLFTPARAGDPEKHPNWSMTGQSALFDGIGNEPSCALGIVKCGRPRKRSQTRFFVRMGFLGGTAVVGYMQRCFARNPITAGDAWKEIAACADLPWPRDSQGPTASSMLSGVNVVCSKDTRQRRQLYVRSKDLAMPWSCEWVVRSVWQLGGRGAVAEGDGLDCPRTEKARRAA
jgi:hypothetical protein